MDIKAKIQRWEELQAERLKTVKDKDEINAIEQELNELFKGKMYIDGKALTIFEFDTISISKGQIDFAEFSDAVKLFHTLEWLLKVNGLI